MTGSPKSPFLEMFEDPQRASVYAEGPPRFTPGFFDIHRMVGILIRERVASDASILVHGCGGGLELESLARENQNWTFLGVDPAKPMLDQAENRLAPFLDRMELHHGYIETAPSRLHDAATSLLTLHFLNEQERLETILQLMQRLKTGAPLVVVHTSFSQDESDREIWLARYEAFAVASGVDPEIVRGARQAVAVSPTMFEPKKDMQILSDAGLLNVTSFYSAFTWRGWVGYVP